MIAVRAADFSSELRRLCPTIHSPTPSLEFERLWIEKVNRPWCPGQENVLGLYGLNQEVAQTASGREGEKYASVALANMARLKARWTVIPDENEWKALEREAPEEVSWLEILINRNEEKMSRLPSASPEALVVFEQTAVEMFALRLPKRGQWKQVRDKMRPLSGLYPQSFFYAARLYDSKLRIADREQTETALSDCVYYLKRLEQRFEIRDWQRALKLQHEIIETVSAKVRKL